MLPHKLLELTLADGKEMDIPAQSIIMFEEMNKDTNPTFPEARCFIRYVMGDELKTAVLSTKVEDIVFELGLNTSPGGWLKLTQQGSDLRLWVLSQNVVSRQALEDGCEIGLVIGTAVTPFKVNESRREIKKWSEREQGRPEGLIEMEVPQEKISG